MAPKAVAAKASSSADSLDAEWSPWAQDLERTFVGLVTVCHLLHTRECEPTFRLVKAAVEGMTNSRLDATTLRVLCAVHGSFVRVEGDDDDSLVVRLSLASSSNKRARNADAPTPSGAAPQLQRRSFSSKPPPSSLLVYRYAFTRPQLAPRRPSERSEHDSMGADAISSSLCGEWKGEERAE